MSLLLDALKRAEQEKLARGPAETSAANQRRPRARAHGAGDAGQHPRAAARGRRWRRRRAARCVRALGAGRVPGQDERRGRAAQQGDVLRHDRRDLHRAHRRRRLCLVFGHGAHREAERGRAAAADHAAAGIVTGQHAGARRRPRQRGSGRDGNSCPRCHPRPPNHNPKPAVAKAAPPEDAVARILREPRARGRAGEARPLDQFAAARSRRGFRGLRGAARGRLHRRAAQLRGGARQRSDERRRAPRARNGRGAQRQPRGSRQRTTAARSTSTRAIPPRSRAWPRSPTTRAPRRSRRNCAPTSRACPTAPRCTSRSATCYRVAVALDRGAGGVLRGPPPRSRRTRTSLYNLAVSLDHLGQVRLAASFYARALDARTAQRRAVRRGGRARGASRSSADGLVQSLPSPRSRSARRCSRKGIISQDQLNIALTEQKRFKAPLGKVLVTLGFVTEATIRDILSETLGQVSIDLENTIVDPAAIALVPKDMARRFHVLPVSYDAEKKHAADRGLRPGQRRGARPDPRARARGPAHRAGARARIRHHHRHRAPLRLRAVDRRDPATRSRPARSTTSRSPPTSTSTASRWCAWSTRCSHDAVKRSASDIHFEPEQGFLRIRYRIDGVLRQIRTLHKNYWAAMVVRLKVMSGHEHRRDARAAGRPHLAHALRAARSTSASSSQPTTHGENIVLRILDRDKGIVPLDGPGAARRRAEDC